MTAYLYNRKIDLVKEAIEGNGILARYYRSGNINYNNKVLKIRRDGKGKIINKGKIVKIMLATCQMLQQYAIRLYISNNINISNHDRISFSVLAKLPTLMVQIETTSPEEAAVAIKGYDIITPQDAKWAYETLISGVFKLNELNAARYKILQQSVDMLTAIQCSFRFLHARADYYFKTTPNSQR
jgi:hypothetical protein